MKKDRLEAFSDGVFAIIITIMVLELKIPKESDINSLKPLLPIFLSYVISFIYLGIFWNNHHHLLNTVKEVSGDILWANLHLLFWLSIMPFVTGWIGESNFDMTPMIFYGAILFMSAMAYYILQTRIINSHGSNSILAKALGKDLKGKISPILYVLAIGLCWVNVWFAGAIYIFVALMWLVPDPRIESVFKSNET